MDGSSPLSTAGPEQVHGVHCTAEEEEFSRIPGDPSTSLQPVCQNPRTPLSHDTWSTVMQ